ncbi:MAG TPA: hypothetical protein VGD56_16475, partial [Gemmatirosa sp.]
MRFRPAHPPVVFPALTRPVPGAPPDPSAEGGAPRRPARSPRDTLAITEALFHGALDVPPDQRAEWLRRHHPDEPDLVAAVLALLAADRAVAGGAASVWLSGGCLADLLAEPDDTTGTDADGHDADGHDADGRPASDGPPRSVRVDAADARPPAAGAPTDQPSSMAAAASMWQGTAPRLAPGDRVGVYRVVRLLGRGGMGAVHLAERVDVGGRVALKLVRAAYARDARAAARFLAERRALARLEHPNVARLLDAGIVEGGPA